MRLRRQHDSLDWLLLLSLVAMWGTSYAVIELALRSVATLTLVTARIVLGAVVLLAAVSALRLRAPRDARTWAFFGVLALLGYCLPFFLITWGQSSIDSGLAGILVGFMPLATLLLAHRFVDGERITATKIAGFVVGLCGLTLLLGPEALRHWRGSGTALLGQLACLGGALCYAANSVVTKRMPTTHALVAAAWTTTIAAVIMLLVVVIVRPPLPSALERGTALACVWLGLGPTAIATIVYFRLIARAGPTFMSMVNYMSPVVAVATGALLLGEVIGMSALLALALILGGIALATQRQR